MLPWDLRLGKSVNGSTLWLTTALWCLRLAGRVSVFNPTLILKKSLLLVSYEKQTLHLVDPRAWDMARLRVSRPNDRVLSSRPANVLLSSALFDLLLR